MFTILDTVTLVLTSCILAGPLYIVLYFCYKKFPIYENLITKTVGLYFVGSFAAKTLLNDNTKKKKSNSQCPVGISFHELKVDTILILDSLEEDGIDHKYDRENLPDDLDSLYVIYNEVHVMNQCEKKKALIEEVIIQSCKWLENKLNSDEPNSISINVNELMQDNVNLNGWSKQVSEKLKKLRPITAKLAETLVTQTFSPIGDIAFEIIPSMFLHSKLNNKH